MSIHIIHKRIVNPLTQTKTDRVYVDGVGWYRWNNLYKVYNCEKSYDQLLKTDLEKIV